MKINKTNRGFDIIEFEDNNGLKCSLQKSSSALADKVWLGIHEDIIKECRMDTMEGWQEIDLKSIKHHPDNDILIENRMHLTQEQVKELLPYLQRFAATGEIL